MVALGLAVTVQGLVQDGTAGASVLAGPYGITVSGTTSLAGIVEQTGVGVTTLRGPTTLGSSGTPATFYLDGGRVLQNDGSFAVVAGEIVLGALPGGGSGGATLNNSSGATLSFANSGTLIAAGTGSDVVNNAGTLLFSNSGVSTITASVSNAGTLHVAAGTLALDGGLQTSGAGLVLASSAELDIGSAGMALTHGIMSSGGTIVVTDATADFSAGVMSNGLGTLVLNNGTLELGLRGGKLATLEMNGSGGNVSVVDSQRSLVLNMLDVTGTALESGAGTTTVEAGGSFAAATDGTAAMLYLDGGRKLSIVGTLALGAGGIMLGGNPLTTAAGGGSLAIQSSGTITMGDGATIAVGTGTTSLSNGGTIEKSTGTGTASIAAALRNSGVVVVETGTLDFSGGGASLGRKITVAEGAVVGFTGGSFAISGTTLALSGGLMVGGGTLDLSHSSVTRIADAVDLTGGTLVLGVRSPDFGGLVTSGTSFLSGAGVLTVTGTADLSGTAVETGTGITLLTDNSTLEAGAVLDLDGGRMVQNNGVFTDLGGEIQLGALPSGIPNGDGTFTNEGTLLLAGTGTLFNAVSGYNSVNNAGYLESTSSGTTTIAANVSNLGTVEVAGGSALVVAGASGTGSWLIDDNSVLDFSGRVGSGAMQFVGNEGSLVLEAPTSFAAVIAGFGGGSVIDLLGVSTTPGLAFTADGGGGGTLSVSGGGLSGQLLFANDLTSHSFVVTSDGRGGALIS